MKPTTAQLTNALVSGLKPVRRLRAPWLRAMLWIVAVVAAFAAIALGLSNTADFAARMRDPGGALECATALATGITSVLAAFHLSVPGRSRRWALLPLAVSLLWLASGAFHCYQRWWVAGGQIGTLAGGLHCFKFIVGASVPLIALLFALLRRAFPMAPGALGAVAALGVAGFAAFLLQFFHPLEFGPVDFAAHIIAVIVVVAAGGLLGRRVLKM
jgi:hypothetical protein